LAPPPDAAEKHDTSSKVPRAPAFAGAEPGKLDGVGKEQPTQETSRMNTDQLKGNWKQFVGKAKEKWGRLTDDDWKVVEGKRDQLAGRIQERYGIAREEAERQVADLEKASRNI
jgi:uncharacterized protein YjbJ (UPF0337 family)